MLNSSIIKKTLYDWLNKYKQNGETVIWADQAEARPSKPYITLKILAGGKPMEEDLINNAGKTEIKQYSEFDLSVNYYGESAMEELSFLTATAEFPTQLEKWSAKNLAYIESSGVRDLTELMETKFESRAQADLSFRTSDVIVDLESTFIETVDVLEQNIDS